MVEVCANNFEPLDIACGAEGILIVNSAWYGRMRPSRCFNVEPGDMGCKTDVFHLVDKWCSGREACHQQVPNKEIMRENECSTAYGLYLEVEYKCMPGKCFSAIIRFYYLSYLSLQRATSLIVHIKGHIVCCVLRACFSRNWC